MRENDRRVLGERIARAFSARRRTPQIENPVSTGANVNDAAKLEALQDSEIDLIALEKLRDAFFELDPEGFAYFAPKLMQFILKEADLDSLALGNLTYPLDRSPTPEYWDEFILTHWIVMSPEELTVSGEFFSLLAELTSDLSDKSSYLRAANTIHLLKKSLGNLTTGRL